MEELYAIIGFLLNGDLACKRDNHERCEPVGKVSSKMSKITCKFGGTSLATVERIKTAAEIIKAKDERRFIVPSAPGKRSDDDKKITDLLYAWHNMAKEGLDPAEPKRIITERFVELEKGLGLSEKIAEKIEAISVEAANHSEPDFMASRGEYLNGQLISEYLGATFVDPVDCIKFNEEGHLDSKSYELLGEALSGPDMYIVPGFYGSMPDGSVKTFSRGGSDVTGSIVARATNSDMYENWTDVSGFRMADPRIVADAKHIEEITYDELRELSYMGASVLHDEAIFPVRAPGIPINIRNTNDPDHGGTLILADRETKLPVCGIAGRSGCSMVSMKKTLMNKERGFGWRVLSVLEEHGVSFEHMPTGIDTLSLIFRDEELQNHGQAIVKGIERTCEPDTISLTSELALIATVGIGMNHHIGVAAHLFKALSDARINIRVIDQGSSEMNIIIGVDEEDLNKAIVAIYEAFVAWE